MNYGYRSIGAYTEVKFNKVPSEFDREQLKALGCKYDFKSRTWTAKGKRAEVLALCDEIVAKSHDTHVSSQPCWECARSGYGVLSTCPWERSFYPVDGWVAKEKEITAHNGKSDTTYEISECPLFMEQRRRKDDYGEKQFESLLNRIGRCSA